MGTKLKNKYWATAAWLLACCLFTAALLSAFDVYEHKAFLSRQYYFHSTPFYQQLETNVNLIKYIHIENRDYPKLTPEEKISQELVARWKKEYGQMEEAAVEKLLEVRKKQYIVYKDNQYEEDQMGLAARSEAFKYFIRDHAANLIYSNVGQTEPTLESVSKVALYSIHLPQTYIESPFLQSLNQYFQQHRLEGYLYIPAGPNGFSQFHADYAYYLSVRDRILQEIAITVAAALLALLLSLYLLRNKACNYACADKCIDLLRRRVPIDFRLLLAVLIAGSMLNSMRQTSLFHFPIGVGKLATGGWLILLLAFLLLNLKDAWGLYLDKQRLREQWERSYVRRLCTLLECTLVNKKITVKIAVLFVLNALLGFFAIIALYALSRPYEHGLLYFSVLYMLFYLLVVVPYSLKRIGALNQILAGAERMACGNLNDPVEEIGSGYVYHLARQLNSMKMGYKRTLEDQMKSERLKSELITNVSHDLKTPLTSILNYIDLLKNKNAAAEQIVSYVEVLDRKAQRLKVLIDDLFEASKMASGAVELNRERVNVAALLEQALAEFSGRSAAGSLTFRTDFGSKRIYASLDGNKTWRIFENLLGNAVKYALPNTRVHVSVTENEQEVNVAIKNVSAYEIDFDVEELFERFKRGDRSRHTEGSGLGLAIAKSIVELQGGQLRIEIDGDYFKVEVRLPKNEAGVELAG